MEPKSARDLAQKLQQVQGMKILKQGPYDIGHTVIVEVMRTEGCRWM